MRGIQIVVLGVLMLSSLAACASSAQEGLGLGPTEAPIVETGTLGPEPALPSPAPADPSVTQNADVIRLLDGLRQRGLTLGNPEESRAAFIYPVPGVAYRLSGGWLHIHPFPNVAAAIQHVRQLPAQLTPTLAEWVAPPHFYRCESAIVLYLGNNAAVMQALGELCGAEFAGS